MNLIASNDPEIAIAQQDDAHGVPVRGEDGKFASAPKRKSEKEFESESRAAFARVMDQSKAADSGQGEQHVDQEQERDAAKAAPVIEGEGEGVVNKEAHAAALVAATRLKIPAKALNAMSPAEIVQAGQDWQKQISENGKLSRELGELREKNKASEAASKEAPSEDAQPSDDLDVDLQPLLARLDVDEETGKVLGLMFKAVEARHASKVKSLESELGKVAEERTERLVEKALGGLSDKFVGLGDDESKKRVLTRMASLIKTGDYSSYDALAEDACKIELPPSASTSQVSQQTSTAKRNGVAMTKTSSPKHTASDPQKTERAAFDKIMQMAMSAGSN